MSKLHLFCYVSLATLGLTGALVACSSDDTIITNNDGGPNPTADAGVPDAEPSDDAGPDVTDAGLKVETYAEQVADTMCNALTRCCFGNANVPDGGTVDGGESGSGVFDRAECLGLYSRLGFENANVGLSTTTKNVVVNQAKGADCIAKINALMCNLDGASLKAIRSACFEALEGQLKSGEACKTSLECASGLFCLPGDGGVVVADGGSNGTCAPLRTKGQPCSLQETGNDEVDSTASEIACSWRGGGDTSLRCASYESTTGSYKADRSTWTCEPTVANGEICNTTVSCADGICDPGDDFDKFVCEPVLTYFNKFACSAHVDP
ncbi:MAG: hypothetical protein BGO98_21220 [Myxococcales bacterium 68-20]|nr:hypothetical protein [Myxococcales bacterium]OJY28080.1 MAG: hypothetical protein BGO98_21220 [Myxococcales bacterium 68-20]